MPDTEITNLLRTEVALIKKDIKQIERMFNKIDSAVDTISKLHKISAVQDTILENTERRIKTLEDNYVKHAEEELIFRKDLNKSLNEMKEDAQKQRERRHKEILDTLQKMSSSLNKKLEVQDSRIRALENWRWWILGVSAALVFILTKSDAIMSFFS